MLVGEGPMVSTRYVAPDAAKAPEGQDFVPPAAGKQTRRSGRCWGQG